MNAGLSADLMASKRAAQRVPSWPDYRLHPPAPPLRSSLSQHTPGNSLYSVSLVNYTCSPLNFPLTTSSSFMSRRATHADFGLRKWQRRTRSTLQLSSSPSVLPRNRFEDMWT